MTQVGHNTRVLLTGGSGFIGSHVCEPLRQAGFQVRIAVRDSAKAKQLDAGYEHVCVGDLGPTTDWSAALQDIDVVIHLAARVHVMQEQEADPLAAYRCVNTEGTRRLLEQAVTHKVRRLLYVSSIKVNGEYNVDGRAFSCDDVFQQTDPYALSKYEAEQCVLQESRIEGVVLRIPLTYGPYVKGNFLRLLRWVQRGYPLPFARICNRRSLLSVDNLGDFLTIAAVHPRAAGEIFLVADNDVFSTPELIRALASQLNKKLLLWPAPLKLLSALSYTVGQYPALQRLTTSSVMDISKAEHYLGWRPPFSAEQGFKKTAQWFVGQQA